MSGKGKVLTLELVFNKTKSDNLGSIKNLNLWGNELQDLQIIDKMPNLEVISLSVNRISSLKDFAKCLKLQQLYLRKNAIADLREIRHLTKLPHLKVLWLHDNPCAQLDNYREIVVHHLPNLAKLDNNLITPEERAAAQNPQFDLDLNNNPDPEPPHERRNSQPAPPQEKHHLRISEDKKTRPFSEVQREEKSSSEVNGWGRGGKERVGERVGERAGERVGEEINEAAMGRNKNILIAILSLMKELDAGSLEIVRQEAERSRNK